MVAVLGISNAGSADLTNKISRLGTNLLTVSPGRDLFGESTQLPVDAIGWCAVSARSSRPPPQAACRAPPCAGSAVGVVAVGVVLGAAITAGWAAYQGWHVVMPVTVLLGGVGAAAVIGTAAGLYPATRAARLTPTQALSTV
jgi:hypothetical protein